MNDAVVIGLATVAGLIFGSFGTVVAYRVPRREDIVSGRSRCPNCGRTIAALENIPVLSYLMLGGKCRGCGERIAARYPLIEAATGVLFGLSAWKFGASIEGVAYAAFFWCLVVLTVIDLEHRILPNRIVIPAFFVGWAALSAAAVIDDDIGRLRGAAMGAALFSGFLLLAGLLHQAVRGRQGMGMGDVKLALVLGTFLGYLGAGLVPVGMFLSFFLGSVISLVWMRMQGKGAHEAVPFGPFLALGTVIAVFAGRTLLDAYLGSF